MYIDIYIYIHMYKYMYKSMSAGAIFSPDGWLSAAEASRIPAAVQLEKC